MVPQVNADTRRLSAFVCVHQRLQLHFACLMTCRRNAINKRSIGAPS